ncbi:MAG: addiction module protein [Sulfuricellaceae bacterium]
MPSTFAEVENQARALSSGERARLAELLLESIHEGQGLQFGTEWRREVEARVAAFDRGESVLFSAEDVFAEAKRIAQ